MLTSRPERVRLVAPLRGTSSGSGAFLGLASDANLYWVKAPNNPQGARTLVAEVVVHGVGALIGAPVCQTALIEIPDSLDWHFTPQHRLRGGLGHASLNVEPALVSDDWPRYSRLDDNRSRQAFILALWDLCMGGDPHWLHDISDEYSIWSFDHGFWLGGDGDWSPESLQKVGTRPWQYDLSVDVASAHALREAAKAVDGLTRGSIKAITQSVPVEWGVQAEERSVLADILYLRCEGVSQRLRDAAANTNFD